MSATFREHEDVSLPPHDAELHDVCMCPQEDEGDSVFFFHFFVHPSSSSRSLLVPFAVEGGSSQLLIVKLPET